MSTTQLIEVFSSLTPLQQKEIVAKMKEMSRPASRGFPKELLDRINEGRERIRAENGELPDSTEFIRRCRDGDEY